MRDKLVYAAILILASIAVIAVVAGLVVKDHFPTTAIEHDSQLTYNEVYEMAWDDACRLSRYVCGRYPRPTVMYTPLTSNAGSYYCGKDIILDDSQDPMTSDYSYSIVVHENVHYLQIMLYGVPCAFTSKDMQCLYEREAWVVQEAIYKERGNDPEDLSDFYAMYNCPRP